MKGFFAIAAFALAAISGVMAAPAAEQGLVKRSDDVDSIMIALIAEVKITDAKYNSTCKSTCTPSKVKSWCSEVATSCGKAVTKCKSLPSGHKFPTPSIIAKLVVELIIEINFTLTFLLKQCGLLGVLISVLDLVTVLVAALLALLNCLVIYVDGLLVLVIALLKSVVTSVTCLICTLLGLL